MYIHIHVHIHCSGPARSGAAAAATDCTPGASCPYDMPADVTCADGVAFAMEPTSGASFVALPRLPAHATTGSVWV